MQFLSGRQLKIYSSLRLRKYRDRLRLFSVSGLNAVQQYLAGRFHQIECLIIEQDKKALLSDISLPRSLPVFTCSERAMQRLTEEKSPQGIVLIAKKPETNRLPKKLSPALYLYRINDPGNLGTIIRTALWYNINTILLSPDSADPFQPKTVRASAGAVSHIRFIEQVGPELLSGWAEGNGEIAGTAVSGGLPPEEVAPLLGQNWLLVMGSEAHGLPPEIIRSCHHLITLPCPGSGESLNLAVAAGICLHVLSQNKRGTKI